MASFIPPPPPEEGSTFQVRRRRAAKLTNFFGVNYRELMSEILESIEKGIEEESGRGTLKPDEIQVCIFSFLHGISVLIYLGQDLVQKLRNLKTKRNSLV